MVLLGCCFQIIGQNGRPRRQEAPWSTSFDETKRIKPAGVEHKKYLFEFSYCGVRWLNRPPVYPGGRHGNNPRHLAKTALRSALAESGARSSRATPCQEEVVPIFAWGRELLPRRPPGYTGVGSTRECHEQQKSKMTFRVRPQTDFIRLVSSKLVLWRASRPPGRPF